MQTAKWMLDTAVAAIVATASLVAHAEGLKAPSADDLPWARWEARLAFTSPAPVWRSGLGGFDRGSPAIGGASLMGDYYFSRSLAPGGIATGFRATSGLIVGPRTTLWTSRPGGIAANGLLTTDRRFGLSAPGLAGAEADTATLPYVGLGYSGLSLRGGWSVSADLGLVALTPRNGVKLGTQGLDELLREMRLSPLVQLGVSYSF